MTKNKRKKVVSKVGFEPGTFDLRGGCFTTGLRSNKDQGFQMTLKQEILLWVEYLKHVHELHDEYSCKMA